MLFPLTCRFCKIIQTEDYDDRVDLTARHPGLQVVSFRPAEPVAHGHRLFVPVLHLASAFENPLATGLVFEIASRFGQRSMTDFNLSAVSAPPAGEAHLMVNSGKVADQKVDHLHVHFIPRRTGDGLSLPWAKGHDATAPVPA